ncbi:MAG TPA: DUF5615 family PIN-like protein, partial [Aggregatilineales bacterium]|nr:DUF5615 family PIN-like protein [Aggregatilineales bacterium]
MTARSLNLLGDEDQTHLERATSVGRVFCTNDTDFYHLASVGAEHAGIVIGQQDRHTTSVYCLFSDFTFSGTLHTRFSTTHYFDGQSCLIV